MMHHYIAYHKVEEWGSVDEIGPEFKYWTAKRMAYLEKTIGQNIWVISGQQIDGKMTYKLCHVFKPEKIIPSGGGHAIKGSGTGFMPHVDVTGEDWFGKLLDEQKKISFGLNEIDDENVINALLAFIAPPPADLSDEIAHAQGYFEGATGQAIGNAYERQQNARAACIAHYGAHCLVCGFDFETQYGERGKGLIDVHLVKSLAEVGQNYRADPIGDFRPVCPNCHTIIHRGKAQLSMEEAKALVRVKFTRQ